MVITDNDVSRTDQARKLEKSGVITEIGHHNTTTFEQAEMIIASPGVPLDMPYLAKAAKKGIPIRGELDVAAAAHKGSHGGCDGYQRENHSNNPH